MDDFLKIDWNPNLEDLLDRGFLDYDRMQKESAMYKHLRGALNDPFADMYKDYEHMVTADMMTRVAEENAEKREIAEAAKYRAPDEQISKDNDEPAEERIYVPGIIKSKLRFPQHSELTGQQQALALKVLLRFSSSEKPSISNAEKEELQTYLSLMPIIAKEQDAFLELVKKEWDPLMFEIQEEDFVNSHWKRKVKMVESLPRYYVETENIPLVSSREIGIDFHSICLEMGSIPKIFVPKLNRRILMQPNTTKMHKHFFAIEENTETPKNVTFKIPVSQDSNCDKLAKKYDIDLVISSGGLNCLALNIDPNLVTSWILPISVKRINEKNVIFIDKPLPPTGLTVMQKNAWLHKYNIKSQFAHPFHPSAASLDDECKETDETNMANENDESKTDEIEDIVKVAENCEDTKDDFVPPPKGQNLFYRLFSIGSSDATQNEMMKNRVDKVYKLLVRSKIDGSVKSNNGDEQLTIIAPKLEHQLALGAEAVTIEEAAKQWMSLIFRPETSLLRVRMEATTNEFIQYEKRTAVSINNEIKRLYGLKTEAALTLLYNIVETMTAMNPGRYIMRHTIRNRAFATIYKETDGPGKNVFDLQTVYWENEFPTIPNPPWPALDKVVVTPSLKCFKRMPAMFHPRKINTDGNSNDRGGNSRGRGGCRGRKKKKSGRGRKKADPVNE